LCETYGQPVLLDAGDLKFNIEKIRELTSRSCSAKQVGPAGGELEVDMAAKTLGNIQSSAPESTIA